MSDSHQQLQQQLVVSNDTIRTCNKNHHDCYAQCPHNKCWNNTVSQTVKTRFIATIKTVKMIKRQKFQSIFCSSLTKVNNVSKISIVGTHISTIFCKHQTRNNKIIHCSFWQLSFFASKMFFAQNDTATFANPVIKPTNPH